MASSGEKSDSTLVSSLSVPVIEQNHHGHSKKADETSRTGASKFTSVEDSSEKCNGCLHDEIDSDLALHNQNTLRNVVLDEGVIHHNALVGSTQSVLINPKSHIEKVNGLKHTVGEHSSSDTFVVNLVKESTHSETVDFNRSLNLTSPVHQSRPTDTVVATSKMFENGASECAQCCSSDSCHYVKSIAAGSSIKCDYVKPDNSKNVYVKSSATKSHEDVKLLATEVENIFLSDPKISSEYLTASSEVFNRVAYTVYESEKQMPDIMRLITKDLSEPYSIYTYRYFIHNWPKLCILAMVGATYVGAIVCKLDLHKKMVRRGYIAMLAVDSEYRRRQIGSTLVTKAIEAMVRDDCDEVVLETEITNEGALHLYENLGFVRDKRLFRYYLNGVDALRLKLWLR